MATTIITARKIPGVYFYFYDGRIVILLVELIVVAHDSNIQVGHAIFPGMLPA